MQQSPVVIPLCLVDEIRNNTSRQAASPMCFSALPCYDKNSYIPDSGTRIKRHSTFNSQWQQLQFSDTRKGDINRLKLLRQRFAVYYVLLVLNKYGNTTGGGAFMSKYCPECGKQLPDDALFCDNCGTKMPDMGNKASSPKTTTENTTISNKTETRTSTPGKRSSTGTLAKLAVSALILFGLFLGGGWLWNKWHYNPALDGDVYPGDTIQSSDALTPVIDETEQEAASIPADHDQSSVQADDPVIRNDSYDFDDVSKLRFEDFDNLYGQITYEGTPADKVLVPLGNANGVWKYNLKIRSETSSGISYFDELGYAEMSVHNNDDPPVRIILHPRLASDGYESWSETDEEVGYEPFGGRYDENDNLKLTGNDCVLLLKEYYAYEGREYLIAELWMSEEEHADFLMMRGQE